MVVFKDISSSKRQYLLISTEEGELEKNGTKLPIHKPLIGSFADTWPTPSGFPTLSNWTLAATRESDSKVFLRSALHQISPSHSKEFLTLGRRIISGKARWGSILKIYGEFSFIPNYWEWLEDVLSRSYETLKKACIYKAVYASLFTYDRNSDIFRAFCEAWCPQTNSLHISVGELSISLWDLHILGGLPIFGKFYDESTPCAAELTGEDELGKRFTPKSCEYLFKAFHTILANDDKKESVSIEDWTAFWYKGVSSYVKPPPRKAKRYSRSKATWNPTGYISEPKERSEEAKAVFVSLGIDDDLVEQTYLAALLSCWLCTFVLPSEEVNTIRPTTFKVASMMASGQEICLAIPVLTSIYKGLNKIANSSTPGRSESYFPAHYLYAWLAYYFYTHYLIPTALAGPKMTEYSGEGAAKYFNGLDARTLIHKGDSISWNSTSRFNNTKGLFIDKRVVENPQGLAYFISIRSSRLVLRNGDSFFVEPYSPHRFGRQFGYCQEIPNELARDERSTTADIALRHWRISIQYKTDSRALFPSSPISFRRHVSTPFQKWWEKVHDDYLTKSKDLLVQSTQSDPAKAKKGKGEEDEARQGIKPPTKNAKDVKNMKGASDKATAVKNIETPACRFPRIVSKPLGKPTMVRNAINKRTIPQEEEESSTSNEECHWKRMSKKAKPSLIDNLRLGPDFFDGVPSASIPLEDLAEGLQLENLEMPNADTVSTSEGSVGSVDGPNSFDLLARRHEDPIVTKALLVATPESTAHERISDIAHVEASPKLPIMQAHHTPSVISTFQGEDYILECQRNYLQSLWKGTSQKIARHRLDLLNSFEEEVDKVMKEMERTSIADVSPLKNLLATFFQNIGHYNSARSSSMEKMSREMKVESLKKAKHSVFDAEIEEGEMVKDVQALQATVASIDSEEAQLKKKLEDLRIRREEAKSSLLERGEKLLKLQANVLSLKEEVSTIEDAEVQSDEDTQYLKKMEELLETSRKELTDFKLFP